MTKGMVYIVGAGCGDKELITVKGLNLIKKADCIIYDDLIDSSLLEENKTARVIYMGKRNGSHSAKQEEICNEIIKQSKLCKTVVRLKGGDPFVFGRGGEEILSLQENDIPFTIVPGISSCIAIPELSGIPVTHRGVSRGFMVVTGHTKDEKGEEELYSSMSTFNGTIVILMGLTKIDKLTKSLIELGKDKDSSVAVISGGNSKKKITVKGNLSNISQRVIEEKVESPAVIVIGKTVDFNFTDNSSFRTLNGLRIGINGTPNFAEKLEYGLREKGADVVRVQKSSVKINTTLSFKGIIDGKEKTIVLTSGNGVRSFFSKIKEEEIDIRSLSKITFAVIGKATSNVLKEYGIKADLVPELYTSKELGNLIVNNESKDKEIVLLRSSDASDTLPKLLKEYGFKVRDEILYSVVKEENEKSDLTKLDYIIFSSSMGVKEFFKEYENIPQSVKVCVIGEVTAKTFSEYSNKAFIMADNATVEEIIKAIEKENAQ